MRLQKFMAEAGVASRRRCEEYIGEGRVLVNGEVAGLGRVIDPDRDEVVFDGEPLSLHERRVVILFYKPRGVVCTANDPEGRKTVMDYFADVKERLFNVGRLDINSEGLLIMTNDGELMQRMTHPKYKIEKTYYVVCDGVLTPPEAKRLKEGVDIGDGVTLPAKVAHINPTKTGHTSLTITIREGRNRQVRRMLEAVGHKTLLLKREQVGSIRLSGLKPGEWRYASQQELAYLHASLYNDKEKL
ncbi:rRNA pseudouridine synthase [Christensenellaceae bacterium OttesenSCG-928-M15]|nr:rRNA pseudouridine synthase [Christensenellaceae bacterium OttesenSCG-928-M15]